MINDDRGGVSVMVMLGRVDDERSGRMSTREHQQGANFFP